MRAAAPAQDNICRCRSSARRASGPLDFGRCRSSARRASGPLEFGRCRSSARRAFGTSILLLNLVGAPSGSVGIYFRLSLIGLEWRMSRRFTLVIDPADVTLPVPRITGTPLSYIQYRFSIGLMI